MDGARMLLAEKTYAADRDRALHEAAEHGHLEMVNLLVPVSNPKSRDSLALRLAAEHGHLAIVQASIPVSEPAIEDSWAIQLAAEDGHFEVVQALIPVSDLTSKDCWALRLTAAHGHLDIVKLLVPLSNAEVDDGVGLSGALKNQNIKTARFLLEFSDLDCEMRTLVTAGQWFSLDRLACLLIEDDQYASLADRWGNDYVGHLPEAQRHTEALKRSARGGTGEPLPNHRTARVRC